MPAPRVILVEDDEMSAELVRFLVQRQGFEFSHVDDGQKALDCQTACKTFQIRGGNSAQ